MAQRTLTDCNEIRQWAEERDATPSCVLGTGGGEDPGMLRLDFPGYSGEGKLQPIDWEEWCQKFEENDLALIVEDTTANGKKSNFNKIVSRSTAEEKSGHSKSGSSGSKSKSKSSETKKSGSR
ncbi:MAG: hypothetical protein QOJ65_2004 [Fimbriimonadaceae bacterium]|nr:hypothetical protein [Fimbriimonadaceae bacterium]